MPDAINAAFDARDRCFGTPTAKTRESASQNGFRASVDEIRIFAMVVSAKFAFDRS